MRRTTAFYLLVSTLLVLIQGYSTENSEIRFESRKLSSRGITERSSDAREIRDTKRLDADSDTSRRLSDRRIIEARRTRLDERIDSRVADAERRYMARMSREQRRMHEIPSYDKRVTEVTSRHAPDERTNEVRRQPQNARFGNVGKTDGLNIVERSLSRRTMLNQRRLDTTDEERSMHTSRTREMSERREVVQDDSGKTGRSQNVLSHRQEERNDRRNRNIRLQRLESNRLKEARAVISDRKTAVTSRMRSLSKRENRRGISNNGRLDVRRQRRIEERHETRQTDDDRRVSGSDNIFGLERRLSNEMQARERETSERMDKNSRSERTDAVGVRIRNTHSRGKRNGMVSQLSRASRDLAVKGQTISRRKTDMSLDQNNRRNQRRQEITDYTRSQPVQTRSESRSCRTDRNNLDNNINRVDTLTSIAKVQIPSEKRTQKIARISRGTNRATYNKSHTRRISAAESSAKSNLNQLAIDYRFFQFQNVYHREGKTERYQDQSRREDASRIQQISITLDRLMDRHNIRNTDRTSRSDSNRRNDRSIREDRRQMQHVLYKNRCADRQPASEFKRRTAITRSVSRDEGRFLKATADSRIDRKLDKRLSTSVDRLVMPHSYRKPESTIQSWFSSQYRIIDDWSVTRALVVGFVGMMGRSLWQKQP